MTDADHSTFSGFFVDEKPEGKGVYTYQDGTKIECEWKSGKKHGEGVITYIENRRIKATWADDEMQGD